MKNLKLSKQDLYILNKIFNDCCKEPKCPNLIKLLEKKGKKKKKGEE